jgi:uncharacterized protein YPO0396
VVTLAQVLWLEEKVHKLYFVAPRALSINDHFRLHGSPKDVRKHYRAQGIEVYDEFARYSQRFRQLLSFRSEKALDLFNQIVSIKEIGSLNAFVREQVLPLLVVDNSSFFPNPLDRRSRLSLFLLLRRKRFLLLILSLESAS